MNKNLLFILAFGLLAATLCVSRAIAKETCVTAISKNIKTRAHSVLLTDSVPPAEVMDVVEAAIYALNSFNIDKVADLYAPNAVVADDEPPYSWNGPTAGVQWVNAVEKVCRDNKLTRLKGSIRDITVFQQSADNYYIVVPVNFSGNLPEKKKFSAEGAFTFVLRMVNGKWMIKSQVWMPKKGM